MLLVGWKRKSTSSRSQEHLTDSAPYLCDSRCLRCKRCKCCWAPHWTPISWPVSPQGHQLRVEFATWMWTEGGNGTSETPAEENLQNLKTTLPKSSNPKFTFLRPLTANRQIRKIWNIAHSKFNYIQKINKTFYNQLALLLIITVMRVETIGRESCQFSTD